MKHVYLLRSLSNPRRTYVGLSDNPDRRLTEHNAGQSPYTAAARPWELIVTIGFQDERRATTFERYLKSGSGHAFARRHLW